MKMPENSGLEAHAQQGALNVDVGMIEGSPSRPRLAIAAAIVAVLFGLLTLKSGGSVLFIDGPDRAAAGDYAPFVLWFNFLAGFAYIIAGAGLFLWRAWGVKLSMLIGVATLLIFVAFGLTILFGGSYELRTVAAMILRSTVWLIIGFFSHKAWEKGLLRK